MLSPKDKKRKVPEEKPKSTEKKSRKQEVTTTPFPFSLDKKDFFLPQFLVNDGIDYDTCAKGIAHSTLETDADTYVSEIISKLVQGRKMLPLYTVAQKIYTAVQSHPPSKRKEGVVDPILEKSLSASFGRYQSAPDDYQAGMEVERYLDTLSGGLQSHLLMHDTEKDVSIMDKALGGETSDVQEDPKQIADRVTDLWYKLTNQVKDVNEHIIHVQREAQREIALEEQFREELRKLNHRGKSFCTSTISEEAEKACSLIRQRSSKHAALKGVYDSFLKTQFQRMSVELWVQQSAFKSLTGGSAKSVMEAILMQGGGDGIKGQLFKGGGVEHKEEVYYDYERFLKLQCYALNQAYETKTDFFDKPWIRCDEKDVVVSADAHILTKKKEAEQTMNISPEFAAMIERNVTWKWIYLAYGTLSVKMDDFGLQAQEHGLWVRFSATRDRKNEMIYFPVVNAHQFHCAVMVNDYLKHKRAELPYLLLPDSCVMTPVGYQVAYRSGTLAHLKPLEHNTSWLPTRRVLDAFLRFLETCYALIRLGYHINLKALAEDPSAVSILFDERDGRGHVLVLDWSKVSPWRYKEAVDVVLIKRERHYLGQLLLKLVPAQPYNFYAGLDAFSLFKRLMDRLQDTKDTVYMLKEAISNTKTALDKIPQAHCLLYCHVKELLEGAPTNLVDNNSLGFNRVKFKITLPVYPLEKNLLNKPDLKRMDDILQQTKKEGKNVPTCVFFIPLQEESSDSETTECEVTCLSMSVKDV